MTYDDALLPSRAVALAGWYARDHPHTTASASPANLDVAATKPKSGRCADPAGAVVRCGAYIHIQIKARTTLNTCRPNVTHPGPHKGQSATRGITRGREQNRHPPRKIGTFRKVKGVTVTFKLVPRHARRRGV